MFQAEGRCLQLWGPQPGAGRQPKAFPQALLGRVRWPRLLGLLVSPVVSQADAQPYRFIVTVTEAE